MSLTGGLGALGATLGVCFLYTCIYNLYFHPLAGFPGPKLAAATRLYEFYYDVIRKGKYVYKIEDMHKRYGMFVYLCIYSLPVVGV